MIPPVFLGTSPGERQLFERFQADPDTGDWVVLHSVDVARHISQIEGEIDFVVIADGLGVLCLEVKAHQRASRDVNGMWRLGSSTPTSRSPFRQASDGMHSLRRFLLDSGMDLKHVPFRSAVWFTHAPVSMAPASMEWHAWQLLDRRDLARPISETITSVLEKGRDHVASTVPGFKRSLMQPTLQQCGELAARIRPLCEFALTPADIRDARDEERQAFVTEQYEALDVIEDEPRVLFTGPAGGFDREEGLAGARRASLRGVSVRMVCFNRLLGAWLTSELKDHPGVTVNTFHQAMLRAVDTTPPDGAVDSWWKEELPELALDALLEDGSAAELLIIDEIQDLCKPAYLDVLDVMVKGGLAAGHWLMFGDFKRQSIYGESDGRSLIKTRAPRSYPFKLYRNCRNRPRIGYAAAQASGLGDAYRGFRRADDTVNPEVRPYETPAEQARALTHALDMLRSDHYSPDEIVVLSPLASGSAAEIGPQSLRRRLAPYSEHTGKIGYTTVHSYKGLDAPAVVVTDIDRAEGEQAEALLYVALSRATDRLIVLAHREATQEMAANMLKGYSANA
jgi:hypothetical protein